MEFVFDALTPPISQPDLFVADLKLNVRDISPHAFAAGWALDGMRVLFKRAADGGGTEVETIRPDGSDAATIGAYTGGGFIDWLPSWSPSGLFVAYSTPRGIQLVTTATSDDVTAVQGPGAFGLTTGRGVSCDELVVGWTSDRTLLVLTRCEGTE